MSEKTAIWGTALSREEVEAQMGEGADAEVYKLEVHGQTFFLPWWYTAAFIAVQPDKGLYVFPDASRRIVKDNDLWWQGCDCERFFVDGIKIANGAESPYGNDLDIISMSFLKSFVSPIEIVEGGI